MHPLADLSVLPGQVAVHWFEQSCYALKDAAGTVIQLDPYFPRQRSPERFIHPQPPLDEATLPTNFVLLTHSHNDHTWPESISRIWAAFPHCRFVGPPESIERIHRETPVNPAQTQVIQAGETLKLAGYRVHAVYAKPPVGDPDAGISPPDVTHLGYVLIVDGVRLYFSGDPIHTFADHPALLQPIADLQPHIGFLTTHPSEGEFPFFAGCVKMAQAIGLRHAVPAHRACFVKRDYDPDQWAAHFPSPGPLPLIIPYNSHILYPSNPEGR
ncbi:MAG: MBL fold metallo-hydrolase [Caldilineaceae bacterium]|nr:MBL fold metallo-hydrolase [Caldilineaceae bacterium]HRJ44343.1 MBL fold metallo-hydrolase [Caldilineaceae bacterium]